MKINKNELQTALEKVKPGLAGKELIEQSTSFAFMGDRVVTYNDEISISHPVPNLDVVGAIQATALYAFLSKIKREEIDIEWEEKQIKITAGKAKAGLVFEQEIKLPVEEVGDIGKWKKLPEGFIDALKFCHQCCSKDMSRPALTCVYINGSTIQATDSYQIVQYTLQKKVPTKAFLIPATAVQDLVKYDIVEIAEGTGWYHFKTADGTVFSTRIFDGEFPEVSKFFDFKGTPIQFPKTALPALERAQIFSKGTFHTNDLAVVVVEVSEGQARFSAKDECGWFEESVKTEYKGEPIRFTTGVEFLINILKQENLCTFGESKIRFKGEKWDHIIAITSEKE